MADIRLVRGRGQRLWLWTGILCVAALLAWGSTFVFGDATAKPRFQRGSETGFGEGRGVVLPLRTERFDAIVPLEDRELGRMVHVTGFAESPARTMKTYGSAVWIRSTGGRRILVRFEPAPPPGTLRSLYAGAPVRLDGYVAKVARAELDAILDSLGVNLPRPKPGVKFGDLPDSTFARVDSLFIKGYYVSVRPEGIGGARGRGADTAAKAAP